MDTVVEYGYCLGVCYRSLYQSCGLTVERIVLRLSYSVAMSGWDAFYSLHGCRAKL